MKYWCHFTARTNDRSLFELVQAPPFVRVPDVPALSELFQALVDRQEGTSLVSLLGRKAALLEILCRFLEWGGSDRLLFDLDPDDRLRRVLSHMEQNLARPVSVEELADIAHLQKNYFIGRFRKAFGMPPIRYLQQRRIELAKELLSRSEESVSEISSRAGFGDAFGFSRSFKDHTGYSPSAWRSLHGRSKD
jgi:AraC family transcriptional regulator, arabinose operon regulatory protein